MKSTLLRPLALAIIVAVSQLFAPLAVAANRPAPELKDVDLYFLSVGSEEYLYVLEYMKKFPKEEENKLDLLSKLRGPVYSATKVAEALSRAGAKHGILLLSDGRNKMIARDDVYDAVEDLKKFIRKDLTAKKARNPRILFYFMGHGLGDAAGRSLYMLPGNIVFDSKASQTATIKLVKRSIWAWDVLSALVNFRTHDSMEHFDNFFPSLLMPDISDFKDVIAVIERQQEMQAIDARRRAEGRYLKGGNPPVPFLVLLDNCYADVTQELTDIPALKPLGPMFSGMVDTTMGEILDEALAYYAAPPGETAKPLGVEGNEQIGPLAYHLIDFIKQRLDDPRPATLRELKQSFESTPSPVNELSSLEDWRPYNPAAGVLIEDDTIDAEMLPFKRPVSDHPYETRWGSGAGSVHCCN